MLNGIWHIYDLNSTDFYPDRFPNHYAYFRYDPMADRLNSAAKPALLMTWSFVLGMLNPCNPVLSVGWVVGARPPGPSAFR